MTIQKMRSKSPEIAPLLSNTPGEARQGEAILTYTTTPAYENENRRQIKLLTCSCESDANYYAIGPVIEEMANRLERGEHYRIGGRLCRTLDEAVNALLEVSL